MKKFLSLVLALVMTMSLVTVAGASFTDAADVNYDEAVDVMTALEVVGGYADGSFNPEGTLTRGAAAKIICNILVGPETAATLVANAAPFADVPANHTFAGYIAYCVNEGIISGYADGTFRPAATLTGYAFMKMLLGAIGYNSAVYTGTNWAINVAKDVVNADLDNGLEGKFNGNKALTREEACLYAFNALNAYTASYSEGSKVTVGGVEVVTGAGDVEVSDTELLRHVKFEDLTKNNAKKDTDTVKYDALGRPAVIWYFDGEKIGTYAETADLVITNGMEEDDFDELFEDLDVNPKSFDYDDTTHGTTWELFFDEDEDGNEYVKLAVEIKAELVSASYGKDKVSTKDEDERYVQFTFADGEKLYVIADEDAKAAKDGVEIDNFEAVYEAIDDDEDQKFLVVRNADKDEVFSVEIPEVIETKVTRVNAKKGTIVAGGETYMVSATCDGTPAIGSNELTVGANGVVYAASDVAAEESEVIYVDSIYSEENKWGAKTYYAQIVNEDNEVAEVVVDKDYKDVKGFCTYELNDDDEYKLYVADDKDDFYAFEGKVDKDDKYVRNDGKVYFADDMIVVYIDGTEDELEVSVKEGAQNITKTAGYVLNSDDDIAVLYVKAGYESGESEDVLYIADTDYIPVANLEGDEAKEYVVYMDGAEEKIMISNKSVAVGFYTYEIDDETGEYELKTKKSTNYTELAVGTEFNISRDTYVDVNVADDAYDFEDVIVSGEIVDLTDEGLNTLAEIDEWDGDALVVSFLYDADEEEITLMYVDFADVLA